MSDESYIVTASDTMISGAIVAMDGSTIKAEPFYRDWTANLDDDREMDEFDRQVIAAGMERVRAEIKELQQKGLLDAQGKPVLKELPSDMQEGAERDFGG